MGPVLDRMSALGASVLPGAVAFRVWAPRCQSVDVVVDGRAVEVLAPREGGLFEARLEGVAEGARYKNRLRSEEHTSELQSLAYLVCRLLLEKKKKKKDNKRIDTRQK